MRSFRLTGVDRSLLRHLQREARRRKLGVNELILQILRRHFGGDAEQFHDLDHLAGQWTTAEAEEFAQVTAPFRATDAKSWN